MSSQNKLSSETTLPDYTIQPGWKILIYQMGKVGSRSIYEAIEDRRQNVHHIHDHNEAAKRLVDIQHPGAPKYFIVTGVRDLLAHSISAFFQNIDKSHKSWYFGDQEQVLNADIEELIAHFERQQVKKLKFVALDWFDSFNRLTGVDVYSMKKVARRGFQYRKTERVEVFCYKLEKMDAALKDLRKRLPIDGDVEFTPKNVAEDKWYNDKYKEFKLAYAPRPEVIDLVFSSKVMRHFYKRREIEKMRQKYIG
ncbi:MAG: putative capsular polysaccharide synthesis family protein [Pseudomonadota bacterium]